MEIVCSHCQTVNRVPSERVHDGAVCAKCKTALLPATPVELSDASFERLIGSTRGLPVVVDFWAPWCGPCRMMAPMYQEAAKQLQGVAILTKLDTEAHQQAAARYGIRSIPTVAIFMDGRELNRFSGARPAAEIVRWVHEQH